MDGVSLATLNELRIISVGDGECLILHIVASHGEGVVLDPEKDCVMKWSRCERHVQIFAGDGTPRNNDELATKGRLV